MEAVPEPRRFRPARTAQRAGLRLHRVENLVPGSELHHGPDVDPQLAVLLEEGNPRPDDVARSPGCRGWFERRPEVDGLGPRE